MVFLLQVYKRTATRVDVAPDDRNTLYLFDFDGINIVHLGGIDRVPSQSEIEELGTVHVALVPIGGNTSLNAVKAAEIVNLLDPNIVIPMHYMTETSLIKLDPLNKFLNEMGLSNIESLPSFKDCQRSQLTGRNAGDCIGAPS